MERPGIADASRATVADDVEPELIEIRLQSGFLKIIGDDARARRERSFHGRIDRQAAFDRLFREQAGGEHHARIARVRAAGDRRDQDAAVADAALAVRESVPGFCFDLLDRIGRRAIRDHLDFVPLVARLDSLVRLCRSKPFRPVSAACRSD